MQSFASNILSAAVVAAVVGSGMAQDLTHSPAPRTPDFDIQSARGLVQQDGETVGFAAGYKAFFNQGGVEYTPALGKMAERNMPLRFTLQSVRRGSQLLLDATGTAPQPAIAGNWVVYDRGDIDEKYEVRLDGVEQVFTFDKRLEGQGDLVVRGRIDSELVPATNQDGSFSWLLPGVGGVHYGLVTGVDAHGNRVRGELRRDGNSIEMSLPAAFVDAASFPLALDPLIGSEFQVGTGNNSDPDVSYDLSNNVYLVVWQNRYSTIDIDVYGQRLNGSTGAVVGGSFTLDFTTLTCTTPRVANVNTTNQFLCVWQQGASGFGPWDIAGRRIDAAAGTLSATVLIASSGDNEMTPCVSGEAAAADNEVIVAWKNQTNGIEARQVTVTAAGNPVNDPTVVLFAATLFAGPPTLSKCGGTVGRHVIAWSDGFITDTEIYAQCIDRNLNLLGTLRTVTANTVNDSFPSIDGDGTDFLVVWAQAEAAANPRSNLRMEGLRYNGATLVTVINERSVSSVAGIDESTPDVCYLGRKYGVVYRSEVTGLPLYDDTFLQIIEGPTLELCGPRFMLDGLNATANSNYENVQRCVGKYAGSGSTTNDEAMAVFGEALNVPPFSSVVIATRFEGVGPGGPIVNLGAGCGSLGLHDTTGGGFALGNNTFTYRCNGVSTFDVMFLSLAFPVPPLVCGGCTLVNPASFAFQANPGTGTVTSVFALPCNPIYLGTPLDSQWVAFNSTGMLCPIAPGLSASNRLRATLQL